LDEFTEKVGEVPSIAMGHGFSRVEQMRIDFFVDLKRAR